jgi:hypothetical protein
MDEATERMRLVRVRMGRRIRHRPWGWHGGRLDCEDCEDSEEWGVSKGVRTLAAAQGAEDWESPPESEKPPQGLDEVESVKH